MKASSLLKINKDFNKSIPSWEIAYLIINQVITCKDKAWIKFSVKETLSTTLIYLFISNEVVISSLNPSLSRHSLFKRIGISLAIVILGALISFLSM